jgi:hypothetical protein
MEVAQVSGDRDWLHRFGPTGYVFPDTETESSLRNVVFWKINRTVFQIKTGRWIMSKTIIFVSMYHHHKLLDLVFNNFKHGECVWNFEVTCGVLNVAKTLYCLELGTEVGHKIILFSLRLKSSEMWRHVVWPPSFRRNLLRFHGRRDAVVR